MRILLVVPEVPYPPHKGTALRNFHLARAMAARHEVRILAAGEASPDRIAPLVETGCTVETFRRPDRSIADRIGDVIGSTRPDLTRRLLPDALRRRVAELVAAGGWDLLQVEGLELGEVVWAARRSGRPIRVLYDAHNVEYRLQWRAAGADLGRPRRWPWAIYSLIEAPKLRRYERALGRAVDRVVAVSEPDAADLAGVIGRPVDLVPNGIDCSFFCPRSDPAAPTPDRPPRIVFGGTLDYRPNVDAAIWLVREILPRVWAVRPDLRAVLVGRDPAPAVRALASDRVIVTGYLPDLRPEVWASDLYVVPLRAGGGTRFKVLEGLALGVPVLTTTLGAEGIGGTPGVHYLVADRAADFADRILAVLADPAAGRDLVKAGRAFVAARYDWSVVTPRLLELYREWELPRGEAGTR